MKQYPSIPTKNPDVDAKFWVFDKIDGSNIRAEWSKKMDLLGLAAVKTTSFFRTNDARKI